MKIFKVGDLVEVTAFYNYKARVVEVGKDCLGTFYAVKFLEGAAPLGKYGARNLRKIEDVIEWAHEKI